jgi:hypothetical protein
MVGGRVRAFGVILLQSWLLSGQRRLAEDAVGGAGGVVGVGACWMVGCKVSSVRRLVVIVLVRCLLSFVLAVVVVGAVVVVTRVRAGFFCVFDVLACQARVGGDGYDYDRMFEGHVRVWCRGGGSRGNLRVTLGCFGLRVRVLDCCGLSMLRGLLLLRGHHCS